MTAQLDDDGAPIVTIDWSCRWVPSKDEILQVMEQLADRRRSGPEHSSTGVRYANIADWAQGWGDVKLARLLREHARTGQELREYAQRVLED